MKCDKKLVHNFEYISVVDTFDTHSQQFLSHPTTQKPDKTSTQFTLKCKVQLYCIKQYRSVNPKHKNRISYLYGVALVQPSFWNSKGMKVNAAMDQLFTPFTAFVIDREGKIHTIFHEKSQNAWVSMVKKSIMDQLQTKLHGNHERVENSIDGKRRVAYTRIADKNGHVLVQKKSDAQDVQMLNQKVSMNQIPRDEMKSNVV